VGDNRLYLLIGVISCSLGAAQHAGCVENIEAFVLHRAHIEIIYRHDIENIQVVFAPINLFIPAHGFFQRDIQAKVVRIDGAVAGDVKGNEKVVISKSGNVRGNIVAPRVTLEDGAIFKGSIDMDPGEETVSVSLASSKPSSPGPDEIAPGLDLKSG